MSPSNVDSRLYFIRPGILDDGLYVKVKEAGWQYISLTSSFPNLEPVRCSMSCSDTSWLAYRLLRRQERWSGIPFSRGSSWPRDRSWVSCIAGRFFTVWATREVKVEVFLEFPWLLYDPANVVISISGSSASSKPSLYIWKFSIHRLLKTSFKDFEHNLPSMWNEHNCTIV